MSAATLCHGLTGRGVGIKGSVLGNEYWQQLFTMSLISLLTLANIMSFVLLLYTL